MTTPNGCPACQRNEDGDFTRLCPEGNRLMDMVVNANQADWNEQQAGKLNGPAHQRANRLVADYRCHLTGDPKGFVRYA